MGSWHDRKSPAGERVPPVTTGSVVGLSPQTLGGWGAPGIDSAQRQASPGVLGWQAQVAVVGDQHGGVDLVGEEVDQQVGSHVDVGALLLGHLDGVKSPS